MDLHLIILSALEGFIEFLPISSTAHLIIASKILDVDTTDSFIKFYLLIIQFGALLAAIVLFTERIIRDRKIFINICISFIPSAVIGFVFYKLFKKLQEGDLLLMALMSLIGGVIFIYLEKIYIEKFGKRSTNTFGKDEMSKKDAFIIGLAQAVAIVPGVSRSGATIIAGIFSGIKKAVIIEYTFMLALPTLGAAVIYDAYKSRDLLSSLHSYDKLAIGLVVSFVVAIIVLHFLRKSIEKISLTAFGWYRIILSGMIFIVFFINNTDVVKDNVPSVANALPVIHQAIIKSKPVIEVKPENIYPGDPVMVTINASSSPQEILFDSKKLNTFEYEGKTSTFIAIPIEEKSLNHKLSVKLDNGTMFEKDITLIPRVRIQKPLGIPEKLGGNTKEAGKQLVNNLAIENKIINESVSEKNTEKSALWSDPFRSPLESTFITDTYGYSRDTVGLEILHKGTDYRAAIGTPVMAMNNGVVRIANKYTVYGNTVIIDHGLGLATLYMHLSKLQVKEGDLVDAGQVIGLSGDTGYAESPHLHISIKIDGVSIDPARFLEFFQ